MSEKHGENVLIENIYRHFRFFVKDVSKKPLTQPVFCIILGLQEWF